jgi:hypothetical protein
MPRQEFVDTVLRMAFDDARDHGGELGLVIDAGQFTGLDERRRW